MRTRLFLSAAHANYGARGHLGASWGILGHLLRNRGQSAPQTFARSSKQAIQFHAPQAPWQRYMKHVAGRESGHAPGGKLFSCGLQAHRRVVQVPGKGCPARLKSDAHCPMSLCIGSAFIPRTAVLRYMEIRGALDSTYAQSVQVIFSRIFIPLQKEDDLHSVKMRSKRHFCTPHPLKRERDASDFLPANRSDSPTTTSPSPYMHLKTGCEHLDLHDTLQR
jgi:hypothetical protein